MKINNKNRILILSPIIIILVFCFFQLSCSKKEPEKLAGIRIGWQPPWANQGQIAVVLKNSNILELNGLHGEFKPFTYGGPMSEAALAGEIDIMFAGSQPAINLISKDKRWKIVARMANYRSAIVVPLSSPIQTMKDLKGKNIATAFGSTTHRETARILKKEGFVLDKDVFLKNLDQAEHAGLIQRGSAKDSKWAEIDAISTYDPTVALVVDKGFARIVKEFETPAVVAMREDFLTHRREDAIKFLKSYISAFYYYAKHQQQVDSIYASEARIDLKPALYKTISAVEPNVNAKSIKELDVRLTEAFQKVIQQDADLAVELGLIKNALDMKSQSDPTLIQEASDQSVDLIDKIVIVKQAK
ncbi:MAG: PhnD/SsuA/transferrin family substrate-binding protein [Ignavibacteriales bacterium]|nr:PhnD/SsuA/transferrin family substrate-binding protein [Ignavibacteriales bacterium]